MTHTSKTSPSSSAIDAGALVNDDVSGANIPSPNVPCPVNIFASPHMALFTAAHDSIQFYRAIIQFAAKHLCPGGRLYFELNPKTFTQVVSFLKVMKFVDIVVENDMRKTARMLVAKTIK